MSHARRVLTVAVLRVAGWNLRALTTIIRWATGRSPVRPAPPLHLPVETVTQQLRTIETLMTRIGGRP